jgi:16S rRNA processing protein RimM
MYIVGKILKPQGIKGEVKVEIITSFPEHFEKLTTVFIENETFQTYLIEHLRMSDRFVFIKFEGVDSRNDAGLLRNKYIYIPEDELTELNADEFYIHDLIGMKVYNENASLLGEISKVETFSSSDIYIVKDLKGNEYMIPAVKDIIKSIDLEKKQMIIRQIDGLLD